nr:DnaD domain protein [Planomicrobium sp. YIM 101495]
MSVTVTDKLADSVSGNGSDSPSDNTSALLNETKLNETKEDDDKTRAPINPFRFFEQEGFGTLSSFVGEQLGDLVDSFGEDRVLAAMKEAVLNGARNLKYVRAILNNPNSRKPKGARSYGAHQPVPQKSNDTSGISW